MLNIDVNAKHVHAALAEHWKTDALPDFIGIIAGDGTMLAMKEKEDYVDRRPRYDIRPAGITSIDSFMGDPEHYFTEVTPYIHRAPISGTDAYAICGEGVMGNEGFVAVVNPHGLVWAACFSVSNPFYEVRIIDHCVEARSTHEIIWRFPVERPWEISFTYLDF
ncbi:hypothetical protein CR152_22715 [Massilia violaceinigra]|uniref:Uncharacterized protein n=1 Tax=Massilia violaceinigra TaxID=2045208 RepID=A0A2D2DPX3_9BURK|nr:hypothetical protein [Massilia violaceinigra]ATQ77011.1 hypothetical protein CR152_22715 [Massilia violaceinigra]